MLDVTLIYYDIEMATLSAVIVQRCGNSGAYLKLSTLAMGFLHWPG